MVVVNKVNAAAPAAIEAVEAAARGANPSARIVRTESVITVAEGERMRGKRVLVIEDGPTITHGSMPSGAGLAAAMQHGAAEVIDPRPWAAGSLRKVYAAWPHIGPVLPAMGYSPGQVADLARTIEAVPCDLVVAASPIDIARLTGTGRPVLRAFYNVAEGEGAPLRRVFEEFLEAYISTRVTTPCSLAAGIR